MDIKDFTNKLNGTQYKGCDSFSAELLSIARENGFVIVSGASDDLVEFEGAYTEEAGCFDGGLVTFDSNGTSDDGTEHKNTLKVFWCGKCDNENRKHTAVWEYETEIPHETFNMYEDEELYCIGLVFKIEDMK